jgi:hypothetical protein
VIAKNVPAQCGTRTFSTGIAYIHKHEHKRHAELVGVGVSFADRVQYASGAEKAAWTHTRGVTSVRTAPVEMEAVAALSKRCDDPVQHEILAYAKGEHRGLGSNGTENALKPLLGRAGRVKGGVLPF